jgi:hypothetical protein
MLRASCVVLIFVSLLVGCRVVEREGMLPLPENGPALTYAEMLSRARSQSAAALDAFYIDAWGELELAARRLEESATALPKTTQIPDAFKTKLAGEADQLRQDAGKLQEAARAKNGSQANEVMQRINQRVRQLRPAEPTIEEKKKT